MPKGGTPARLGSLDAYRGFVMFLMMAEVLQIGNVARAFPDSTIWQFLAHHTDHVDWSGCVLHDMIQPSFSFLVGAALPYSIASRMAKGQSFWLMFGHAVWRPISNPHKSCGHSRRIFQHDGGSSDENETH